MSERNDLSPHNCRYDTDFNPSVELMIHDYDDERTIEEEEALGSVEDPQIELSSLRKEGDLPLEDLMGMYGYNDPENMTSVEEMSGDKSTETDAMDQKSEPSELEQLYNDTEIEQETSVRSTRYVSRQQSEDEEDYDYRPEEEERKKTIMVGSDYQACIPEGLCKYDDALPYENEDKLVWDPNVLDPIKIEDYLIKSREPLVKYLSNTQGVSTSPVRPPRIRDDEQALYLLLQCGYNIDEALRRKRINAAPSNGTMSVWSEEEYQSFENGLQNYGKDFRQIQQDKVRTRSVGELVQFYYLWKKTERHDVFANTIRLEKKKYALHPGITDYMDRFLDEQEAGIAGSRDRSASPNIQCLIYADPKWQRTTFSQLDDKDKESKENDLKLSESLNSKK